MFQYRIAYGCWLNDSNRQPIENEDWPSIRIDEDTLSSLDFTMDFLEKAGYNCFDVFGLITNHSWEDDIPSTITKERVEKVRQVIDIVHRHGLKVIYGLGVYSWGFDGIISRNPKVRGTNPQAMCASSPESETIMRSVIDFVMSTFDIDGFHLEAADQGRCDCPACRERWPEDIDYYNSINILTAKAIREKAPDRLLLVNTSGYLRWGDTFNAKELEKIRDLGKYIDIFIDVGSHGAFVADADRNDFLKDYDASFGNSGGFWIYPPQRWARNRWLIPHVFANHESLLSLYRDGGNAAEMYLSPLNNPGAAVTMYANGLYLQDPESDPRENLEKAVEAIYQPGCEEQKKRITAIFEEAEKLFFGCYHPQRDRQLPEDLSDGVEHVFAWSVEHPDKAVPGEFFLERLFGIGPGFPCYLTLHFDHDGRVRYREGMEKLLKRAEDALQAEPGEKLNVLADTIRNVLADIDLAEKTVSKS